jgi:hypothetical protein
MGATPTGWQWVDSAGEPVRGAASSTNQICVRTAGASLPRTQVWHGTHRKSVSVQVEKNTVSSLTSACARARDCGPQQRGRELRYYFSQREPPR